MRYVTAVYVPREEKYKLEDLVASLTNIEDLERIYLPGRWRDEESFSVYTFYSWWNTALRFAAFTSLIGDRELKILHFDGLSASFDKEGFSYLISRCKLSLLAKATLWAGVKHYFRDKQSLCQVQCYVEGAQESPITVASLLGKIETIRTPRGSLYMFHVTDIGDLKPLVRIGLQCLIQIGNEEFTYDNDGLLPTQQGDMNKSEKYLNLS